MKRIFVNSQQITCHRCNFIWFYTPYLVTSCPNCNDLYLKDKDYCRICGVFESVSIIKFGLTQILVRCCLSCFMKYYFVSSSIKLDHLQKILKCKSVQDLIDKIVEIDLEEKGKIYDLP